MLELQQKEYASFGISVNYIMVIHDLDCIMTGFAQ